MAFLICIYVFKAVVFKWINIMMVIFVNQKVFTPEYLSMLTDLANSYLDIGKNWSIISYLY